MPDSKGTLRSGNIQVCREKQGFRGQALHEVFQRVIALLGIEIISSLRIDEFQPNVVNTGNPGGERKRAVIRGNGRKTTTQEIGV